MKFILLNGATANRSIEEYRIDWDTKVKRGKFGGLQWEFKQAVYPFWKNHIVYEELKLPNSRKSVDFFNLTSRVVVEIQGKQHTEYSKFFHGNRVGYYNQKMRDLEKSKFCELNGFEYIQIFQGEEMTVDLLRDRGAI
jgi:hypothetical protein